MLDIACSNTQTIVTPSFFRMDDSTVWMRHLKAWPKDYPLCVHAEQAAHTCSLPAVLYLAAGIYTCSYYLSPYPCPSSIFFSNSKTDMVSVVQPTLNANSFPNYQYLPLSPPSSPNFYFLPFQPPP